jgi:hypothetical protein
MIRHGITSTLLLLACQHAWSQTALVDVFQQRKIEWIIGQWEGAGGATVTYRWQLDGKALISETKAPSWKSYGLHVYDPAQKRVRLLSVQDTGSVTTGTWEGEGDQITLRLKTVAADTETIEFGVVYRQVDQDHVRLTTYGMSDGKLGTDPIYEADLRRSPPANAPAVPD